MIFIVCVGAMLIFARNIVCQIIKRKCAEWQMCIG